jgi:DNA-binding NtrC family response regulator
MTSFSPAIKQLLANRDVLLVEDETMISFLIEDMLAAMGAGTVRHAARIDKALALIAEKVPAVAVLDVNIAGELVFPVAERLEQARVPFFFMTGYGRGGVDARWAAYEVLQKPFTPVDFEAALRTALTAPATTG